MLSSIKKVTNKIKIGKGSNHIDIMQAEKISISYDMKTPAKLSLPGIPASIDLVGREDHLAEFTTAFSKHDKGVITGIGGIGKTEFLKAYVNKQRENKKQVGWFEYQDSFRNTLLNTKGLIASSTAHINDPKSQYDEIISMLRDLSKDTILVFDNVRNISSKEDLNDILSLSCQVVFTTRESFSNEENRLFVYSIDFLSMESCFELFNKYSKKTLSEEDLSIVKQLIQLAGQHTLALELLGKTCRATRGNTTVRELLHRLEADGFNLRGLAEEVKREGEHDSQRFMVHMMKLYDATEIERVGPFGMWLLANLCLLPLVNFQICNLIHLLNLPDLNLLNQLDDLGWVRIAGDNTVTMHNVVSEILRCKLQPEETLCFSMIKKLLAEIKDSQCDEGIEDVKRWQVDSLQSILQYTPEMSEQIADSNLAVSMIDGIYGDFDQQMNHCFRSLIINEKIYRTNYLGFMIYSFLGLHMEEADIMVMTERCIQRLSQNAETLGDVHQDTLNLHILLGILYTEQKQYGKAKDTLLQAWDINDKLFGEGDNRISIVLYNLGYVFFEIKNYQLAMNSWKQALEIREDTKIAKEQSIVASIFHGLGLVNTIQYDNVTAIYCYNRSIEVKKKIYGKAHVEIVQSYLGMATAYKNHCDYEQSLRCCEEALTICKELFGEMHISTAKVYRDVAIAYSALAEYEYPLQYFLPGFSIDGKSESERWNEFLQSCQSSLKRSYQHYDAAARNFQYALSIYEKIWSVEHLCTLIIKSDIKIARKKMYKVAADIFQPVDGIHED